MKNFINDNNKDNMYKILTKIKKSTIDILLIIKFTIWGLFLWPMLVNLYCISLLMIPMLFAIVASCGFVYIMGNVLIAITFFIQ